MGVLQKAYTFVKKHWSTDDDVFPDDLNRYEDGIDDLYSVTNQTNTNIGNLSNLLSQAKSNIVTAINEIVTNLQSEIETRGNTDTELERKINVLSTNKAEKKYVDEQDLKSMNYKALIDNTRLYMTTQTGIYLTPASGVTDLPEGWAQGRHTLVCFNPNNDLYGFQLITTYAGSSGIGNNRKFAIRHAITEGSKWLELANTEKTDILVAPNTGYTITFNKSCKINNIAYINVRVKKTDGSEFISGAQVTPFTLPLTAGGETNGNGNGASGGFWRVPATVLFTGNTVVVNPTSNCTQIHITGVIVL